MNPKAKRLAQLSLCTLFFICAACQSSEMQKTDEVKDTKSQAASEISQDKRPAKISLNQQIEGAKNDLAVRIGVEEKTIKVREARSVQWGSGAMGCPKPGRNYTQAIVPGVLLLLELKGTIYHYHGGTGRKLFYCPAQRVRAPAYGQGQEVM